MIEKQNNMKEEDKKDSAEETEKDNNDKADKKNKAQEQDKKEVKKEVMKEEAVAYGNNIHTSRKQNQYVCRFIKNKKIDAAIKELEEVIKLKRAVPFKGEIPHRKGKGMMSGRYPVKASGIIITLLKALKGNAIVNGLDMNKTVITESVSNWASRPAKSDGRYAKRTHLVITAREKK